MDFVLLKSQPLSFCKQSVGCDQISNCAPTDAPA
uniref:Uncharacterized protein n=1 Tax=Anguilla anguilla TaxID=7936 RepID=A0A0E9UGH4_ANGAN